MSVGGGENRGKEGCSKPTSPSSVEKTKTKVNANSWSALSLEDKLLSCAQFVLKTAIAILGWHALLSMPSTIFESDGTLSPGIYPYEMTVFMLLILATLLDMWWHWNSAWTDGTWVHHLLTFAVLYITGTTSDLSRKYMCYNAVAESVAPLYQLIKLGYYPQVMKALAIGVNLCVREPYFIWITTRTSRDLWLYTNAEINGDQIAPVAFTLLPAMGCGYLVLDYMWTMQMIVSLRRDSFDLMKQHK
jgi:hypothetical protein